MKTVVIVAHGSPSDPERLQAQLDALGARVQALSSAHEIRCATLAKPGALQAALAGVADPLIYPFFMAQGWFTQTELPRRIAALGVRARVLAPFGVDPGLPDLIATRLREAASTGPVILVAHGSKIARRSRDSVYDMAETLRAQPGLPQIRTALIEEPPFLADVAAESPDGVCLPFFALRAGHVEMDIPEALESTGYRGRLLPEIGADPEVPGLISKAISRA